MSGNDKWQLAAELVIFAAGAVGCLLIHPAAAVVLAGCGAMILAVQAFFRERHRQAILHLCNEIGAILRGAEQISIRGTDEGELGILASEIRKIMLRLQEQNRALLNEKTLLRESLEDISHQLRTPLTAIALLLEMMRDPQLDRAQQEENLRELHTLLNRMQWLIETLLGLSRLEAGAVTFRSAAIDCRELVAAALEPISIALELKGIEVQTVFEDHASFSGDFQYCTEALLNLLKNCMEHTPAGGCIRIEVQQNAVYTGILITDSGSGLAPEDLPHIFERFYRSGSFSKAGYGIGLSFAQRVIAAQNGSIQVRNAEPCGAQFDIRFYPSSV